MDQPKRRHLHAADITCLPCIEKQDENDRLRGIVKTLQLELNRTMEDLAGMTAAAGAAGRAAVAAKGQRTKQAKAEARLEQLEAVVEHWRSHRPRTGPEFGSPGSKSFDVIEKALILMAEDDAGPVGACNEAVDGLHLAPWQRYDKRFAKPVDDKAVLRNSIEHALGDEARIERCRQIVRWAKHHAAEVVDVSRAVRATADAWERYAYREVFTARSDSEPRFVTVEGIEVREDGR